jgi:regulation of enolase protein 1 (concanavalin A-like superfamily)
MHGKGQRAPFAGGTMTEIRADEDHFIVPPLSFDFQWENRPVRWQLHPGGGLSITAGPLTDLFVDPAGGSSIHNAPSALCTPTDRDFMVYARVTPTLMSTFDAGGLQIRAGDGVWAKLCLEYSPQRQATVVSVVTRDVSDDCNSDAIDEDGVYLRIARTARTCAFHYSRDGHFWHLVRYFSLGEPDRVRVGFSSQSPQGAGCTATFSEITYVPSSLDDIRNGT